MRLLKSLLIVLSLCSGATSSAQSMYFSSARVKQSQDSLLETMPATQAQAMALDSAWLAVRELEELNAYLDTIPFVYEDSKVGTLPLPNTLFLPAVYDHFEFQDHHDPFTPDLTGNPATRWIEEETALARKVNAIKYNLFFEHPEVVRYSVAILPEAPKQYRAVIDPSKHTVKIEENIEIPVAPTIEAAEVKKRHWIRKFDASLQFSQAYISPNWYQGGTNNLNMLGLLYYNVKLNTEFHPNLLFETTAQYKLGMNNAPTDSVNDYTMSDDLFQVNTTFGLKATGNWYYSFTGQFKTQIFNSYPTNSRKIQSAFMSPGELTIGLGMTYNFKNKKKTLTFDASLAPLSYNLKTCINKELDPTNFNIKEGHKSESNFGSSAELKLGWQIAYNIAFTSRVFAFTDYDSAQLDWENRVSFTINRFLSTQLYAHARYDSSTPPCDNPKWKKFQLKEILSIGFSYTFSTI
ncbi:MAG: DUF3078 domain-containing protein [Bacteroidales bacterium]|nr:DUF3078 domain-containing protein [Bacteroidales bacterium]